MSATLVLPGVLREHAGGRRTLPVRGATVREVLDRLAVDWPALERRLRDEQGGLRPHVLIFVDGLNVRDALGLETAVPEGAELYVAPAVSGG
ncbi:MAG TPA: ubiquitin-like small modifier protein 1 [Candidatus Dormibacteraeota bacterium]|nr:ubiquitin-like small modifier protein 1 [Candidatus Dormibacteraeota bacterium]